MAAQRPDSVELLRTIRAHSAQAPPAETVAGALAVAERLSGTLVRTYRHLRLVLVAAAPVILLAIATVWTSGYAGLPSISHYYYTPARAIFVGALVTTSAALLALSGRGAQRGWLDLAALFAPLIALVPTPIRGGEVPGWEAVCPPGEACIPDDAGQLVATGVTVWFVCAGAVIVVAVLGAVTRRSGADPATAGEPRSALATWTPIVAAAVVVMAAAAVWGFARDVFLAGAHVVAASAFFIIIAVVAIVQVRGGPPAPAETAGPDAGIDRFRRRAAGEARWTPRLFTTVPGWIALLLTLDLVVAGVILASGEPETFRVGAFAVGPIFVVEAVALLLFTVFWAHETVRKWNEADPD